MTWFSVISGGEGKSLCFNIIQLISAHKNIYKRYKILEFNCSWPSCHHLGFVCFSRSTRMWRSKGPACEMILRNINSEKHVCCRTILNLKRKTSVFRNKCLCWSKVRQVFQPVSIALVASVNSCVIVWFCLMWTSSDLFSTFVLLLRL